MCLSVLYHTKVLKYDVQLNVKCIILALQSYSKVRFIVICLIAAFSLS